MFDSFFTSKEKCGKNNQKCPVINRIKIPKFTPEELRIYYSAPEWARRKGYIHLRIIKLTGGYNGKRLRDFIRYWNKQYPDQKTSYTAVMRAREKIQEEGLSGLLAKYSTHNEGKSVVAEDIYSMFKDLYLADSCPTATSCYEKAKQEYVNPAEEWKFPSYQSFLKRLSRKFSKKEIDSF